MCNGRAVAPPPPLPSSWGKLLQRIADLTGSSVPHPNLPPARPEHKGSVCDTGADNASDTDSGKSKPPYNPLPHSIIHIYICDSIVDDPFEEPLCADVLQLIEQSLMEAKRGALRCFKLLIPDQLTARVAEDLLRLASSEPCGLRGAVIDLNVEDDKLFRNVDRFAVDGSLSPTFELTLVLRLEAGLWPKIQDLFTSGPSFTPGFRRALRLSPGFRIIKRKLYSPTELVIEQC
uniref:DNA damage-inducible transcript 4 protein n=1 Tax=Callorhinchus milii TaxID=7868 RepID=A0A4W3H646_CALMI